MVVPRVAALAVEAGAGGDALGALGAAGAAAVVPVRRVAAPPPARHDGDLRVGLPDRCGDEPVVRRVAVRTGEQLLLVPLRVASVSLGRINWHLHH